MLKLSRFHIVGLLHYVWSWADQQTVDGNARGVTLSFLNEYTGVTGFGQALEKVGWLVQSDGGLSIPKFDSHISQSAKYRALTDKRVKKKRQKDCNAPRVTKALLEKRREEKNTSSPSTPPSSFESNGVHAGLSPPTAAEPELQRILQERGMSASRAAKWVASTHPDDLHEIVRFFDEQLQADRLERPPAALRSMIEQPEEKWDFERNAAGRLQRPGRSVLARDWASMTPEEIWHAVKTMKPTDRKAIFKELPAEIVNRVHQIRRKEVESSDS